MCSARLPDQPNDYWRHPELDRPALAAPSIFLEHNPGIVVLQPRQECGLLRSMELTPNPGQALELRRFNFRMRRA